MAERVDSLDRHYQSIEKTKSISNYLFGINVFLSIILLLINEMEFVKYITTIFFIVTTLLYFIVDNYLSVFLIPSVEEKRRTHLLTDSLGIPLDAEYTNLYYNNNLQPSILRLGANILENSLFSLRVTSEMVKKEGILILLYTVIWLGCMVLRNTDLALISVISQTLFATTLIPSFVRLVVLRNQNKRVHDELYRVFLLRKTTTQKSIVPLVIDAFVKYESAKAYSGIKQSSRIFFRINDEVTQEWAVIKNKLGI